MASPPKIFICYRRTDSAPYAGRIAEALVERYGKDNVYFDVKDVGVGEDFDSSIMEAARACDVMLVIIGRQWLESHDFAFGYRYQPGGDSVLRQIAGALKAKKAVVPVLVNSASFPNAKNLPKGVVAITERQALILNNENWHDGIQTLFRWQDSIPRPQTLLTA